MFYNSATTSCQTCTAGYFGSTITYQCEKCALTCATCAGSASTCVTCATGFVLYVTQCLPSCPDGFYAPSGTTQPTCQACPTGCNTCTSGTTCTSCQNGFFLFDALCYATCPGAYYGDTSTRVCTACPTSCSVCASPTSCSSCTAGFELGVVATNTICVCAADSSGTPLYLTTGANN